MDQYIGELLVAQEALATQRLQVSELQNNAILVEEQNEQLSAELQLERANLLEEKRRAQLERERHVNDIQFHNAKQMELRAQLRSIAEKNTNQMESQQGLFIENQRKQQKAYEAKLEELRTDKRAAQASLAEFQKSQQRKVLSMTVSTEYIARREKELEDVERAQARRVAELQEQLTEVAQANKVWHDRARRLKEREDEFARLQPIITKAQRLERKQTQSQSVSPPLTAIAENNTAASAAASAARRESSERLAMLQDVISKLQDNERRLVFLQDQWKTLKHWTRSPYFVAGAAALLTAPTTWLFRTLIDGRRQK